MKNFKKLLLALTCLLSIAPTLYASDITPPPILAQKNYALIAHFPERLHALQAMIKKHEETMEKIETLLSGEPAATTDKAKAIYQQLRERREQEKVFAVLVLEQKRVNLDAFATAAQNMETQKACEKNILGRRARYYYLALLQQDRKEAQEKIGQKDAPKSSTEKPESCSALFKKLNAKK